MAEISCKHCSSLDCRGCNIYRLEQMLDAGKFDAMMNKNRTIQISADVAPVVHGRWVDSKCDNCGKHAPYWCLTTTFYESNYCPNCGADMRTSEEPENLTYIPPEERSGVDDG